MPYILQPTNRYATASGEQLLPGHCLLLSTSPLILPCPIRSLRLRQAAVHVVQGHVKSHLSVWEVYIMALKMREQQSALPRRRAVLRVATSWKTCHQ